MRNKSKIIVGLEVGTSKVTAIVGEIKPDNSIQILGFGRSKSVGIRKGEINDFDMTSECIYQALNEAELKANVTINELYLACTGGHIKSFSHRGDAMISGEESEVCLYDLDEVEESAKEAAIPAEDTLIHAVLQHYYVDGKEGIRNPVGQLGTKLEADYLLIHGRELRIKNAIKCVKSTGVEVYDVVFSPVAAAQTILKQDDKRHGAIMIDIGAGTTEYVVYANDAIKHAGVIAVGGEHITNDISIGLKPTSAASERLKIEHGSLLVEDMDSQELVNLRGELAYEEWTVSKADLTAIMRARVEEIFELVHQDIESKGLMPYLRHGVYLTGGSSMIVGIAELAEEVFELPVNVLQGPQTNTQIPLDLNPEYSVVVGLLKYAHKVEEEKAERMPHQTLERISRRVMDFIYAMKSLIF